MKVAILGCGPAGLVAAQAAAQAGADIQIFSKRWKSELFGAQYLHEPIPGIDPGEKREIRYTLVGSVDDYRRKVYGPDYDGTVSPQGGFDGHPAWDIRHTYDQLWARYYGLVCPADIGHSWLLENAGAYDAVLSTIPLPVICWRPKGHSFRAQTIYAYGDAPERGQEIPKQLVPDETVICNGRPNPYWYRASRLFGYATLEWSPRAAYWPAPAAYVQKPLSTDCDCWPGIARFGRYGRWQKGVLVHQTYEEVTKCLIDLS